MGDKSNNNNIILTHIKHIKVNKTAIQRIQMCKAGSNLMGQEKICEAVVGSCSHMAEGRALHSAGIVAKNYCFPVTAL